MITAELDNPQEEISDCNWKSIPVNAGGGRLKRPALDKLKKS
jgi:hypothetical protein